jgi:hypothetical protein
MRKDADSDERLKGEAAWFEERCRRLLQRHLNGVILQLSNLGRRKEFEAILDRLDRMAAGKD